jgi:uncharacterized protein YggE
MNRTVLLITALFISWNVYCQEFSTLTVDGKAIIKEIPENMLISITVSSKDPNYATCSDILTKNSNSFQKELITNGIDPKIIKMSGFNIEEDFEYKNNTQVKVGYQGSFKMSIECPYSSKSLSTVMEIIKQNPYQFTYIVNFVLSESQKQEIINFAVEKSITDAINKAELIAKAANLELVRINSIKYTKDYYSYEIESDVISLVDQRVPLRVPSFMMMAPSEEMSINQEELAIEKVVTVEWITKQK